MDQSNEPASTGPPKKKARAQTGKKQVETEKEKEKEMAGKDDSSDEESELGVQKTGKKDNVKAKAKAEREQACKWAEAHVEEVGQKENPSGQTARVHLNLVRTIGTNRDVTQLLVGYSVQIWHKEKAKASEKWTVYRLWRAANGTAWRLDLCSQADQRFLTAPIAFVTNITPRDPKETAEEIKTHYEKEQQEFDAQEKKKKDEAEERKKKQQQAAKAHKATGRVQPDNFGNVVRPADLKNALDEMHAQADLLAAAAADLRKVSEALTSLQESYVGRLATLEEREGQLWQKLLSRATYM